MSQSALKGVVIGKFYPPHNGHCFLIESALAQCDQLTVIVCKRKDEKPSGSLRQKWIQKLYPQAKVILIDDHYDQDDSELWAKNTITWLGYRPDVVFTSESYGTPYAYFLQCKHVLVDLDRKTFPISGTLVRNNPYKYWKYLKPIIRQFYLKRICVAGAESTGTTTLAQDLATYFQTCWVPEYGRTYWEGKLTAQNSEVWTTDEFIHIANQQNILEDQLALSANKLLICDTNSWVTTIWHQRYMKSKSDQVEEVSKGREYDLYLVTDIDIPFIQDGTRDGEHIRVKMHKQFITSLKKNGQKFIVVSGDRKSRLKKAVNEITKLFPELEA